MADNFRKPLFLPLGMAVLAFCALAAACSPRVAVSLGASSSLECDVSVSLDKAAGELVSSLSPGGIFKADALKASLERGGFETVTVRAAENTELAFTAKASSAQRVFSALPEAISFSPGQGQGQGSIRVLVSRETAQGILKLLPQETIDYLDFFMAPLFTGESMTEAEYTAMIQAVYGAQMAASLKKSAFVITFAFPGKVTAVEAPGFVKKESSGNRAAFTIPLAALLAPSGPLVFGASWNRP